MGGFYDKRWLLYAGAIENGSLPPVSLSSVRKGCAAEIRAYVLVPLVVELWGRIE